MKEYRPITASDYLDKLRGFAGSLQAHAERMDRDAETLAGSYRQFVAESLHVGWSDRQPLSGREFCEVLAILAQSSGAFGFLALQQFVANTHLAGRVPEPENWPCVGVAFGHLRRPAESCPRWEGDGVSGFIPWLTGVGIFPQIILGLRDPQEREVYALVDATDRAAFRHSAPMDLIACSGTRTVSVQVKGLPIDPDSILKRDMPGTMARNDAMGVLYQTPLMVGCIRACWELIRRSTRVGVVERARCETATETLLERVYAAFEGGTPAEGQQLRAELGDFAVRLARLAVMASGGVGLVHGHPVQRLYREALLYSLMAQTDSIINQAFQEVFP